jgi:hypothetical protein
MGVVTEGGRGRPEGLALHHEDGFSAAQYRAGEVRVAHLFRKEGGFASDDDIMSIITSSCFSKTLDHDK